MVPPPILGKGQDCGLEGLIPIRGNCMEGGLPPINDTIAYTLLTTFLLGERWPLEVGTWDEWP